MHARLRSIVAAGLVGAAAGSAHATWSILIVNPRTGEIGVASATCLFGLDLRELTPLLITDLGGVTAQSFGDTTGQNRTFIRDRMIQGFTPPEILDLLAVFDAGHQTRQYGMVDVRGGVATFTGTQAGAWAGGVTGQVGELVYCVQGNVLTGAPVVALAEQAIIATPGDLPEKLMAAMEAAASMGGDGRCSCSAGDPEGCGSPPPSFDKSAHVGYMLVARPGDFSAANGVYGMGDDPGAITVVDLDRDGRFDVVAAEQFTGTVHLFRNITPPGGRFTMLEPTGTLEGPNQPAAMLTADVTGDQIDDVLLLSQEGDTVRVYQGDGIGGLTPVRDVSPGNLGTAHDLQLGLGGLVVIGSTDVYVLDPTADFAAAAQTTLAGELVSFAPDPADAAAGYAASSSGRISRIVRTGNTLAVSATLELGVDVVSIVAKDFNADGRTDLFAVSTNARQADLLLDDGSGGYVRQSFPLGRLGRDALAADFDGDGDLDPAALTHGRANLFIVRNQDNTSFAIEPEIPVTRAPLMAIPHDLTGDGLPEVVTGGPEALGVVIADNIAGRFAGLLGTAGGDFFMQLNVANTTISDPDPVLLLREQFDLWRADLVGKVDAVQSSTQMDALAVPAGSGRDVTLNITLRDWQGDPVTGGVNLRIEHADGSQGVGAVQSIENLGGGHYRATIRPGSTPGRDVLDIIADAGDRTVVLTPRPVFIVSASSADFDGDGVISFSDVQAFLRAFASGSPTADLTGDGVLDFSDVQLFLDALGL